MMKFHGKSKPWRPKITQALLLGLWLVVINPSAALGADWQYKPPCLGVAMMVDNAKGCNWIIERPLAQVNSAPEFTFPLQLFYHSARNERGLFGAQWFCPQLESTLLPRGKNVLAWNPPWGGVVGLFLDETNPHQFLDREKKYLAKISGIQTTITTNEGWVYEYRTGRLEKITASTGRQLDFVYSGPTLTQIIMRDLAANVNQPLVVLAHDGQRRVIKLAVNNGIYQFGYQKGNDSRLEAILRPGMIDPEVIQYDHNGVLASIKPAGGALFALKTEYAKYNQNQLDTNAIEQKKPANYALMDDGTYWYTYGKDGAVTITDRSGVWQSFAFSKARSTEMTRNSAGEETVKYYYMAPGRKHNGKLNRIEKNGRVVLQNFYDKRTGNLIESRDENEISTIYEYSSIPIIADKPVRVYRCTRAGNRELLYVFQYDSAGRVLSKTEPGKRVTQFSYNARGELSAVTDPEGTNTNIRRDQQGRVVSANNGNTEELRTYDDNGRIRTQTRADGQTFEYTYDVFNNVASIKQNSVMVAKYQRDKNGVVTALTDANNRTTKYELDPKGRLLSETQPNGTVTKYEYDEAGHRTAQIDGKGNRITFKYDLGGHLVEQKNPLGQTLTWLYDTQGRLVERTNGVQKVRNTYTEKGRLKMIDYGAPGEKVVYSYDDQGRVRKASTPTNSVTFFYDDLNRVVARQMVRDKIDRVVRYSWDAAGRKTSVVLSEKMPDPKNPNKYKLLQQTDYAYDGKGRLAEIKSNGSSVCRYTYDKKGRLVVRQYGNGIAARYTYDNFGRQTRLELTGRPLTSPLLLAYQWDAAGQLLARAWNNETQVYGYDPSGQLLTVSKPGAAAQSQVALVANQAPANQVDLVESYKYDPAGNMLAKFENGESTAMTYDTANQLVSAVTGDKTTQFKYDAAGRLVSQTTGEQAQSRAYGFLDKVLILTKPDGTRIGFDYYPDGQLAAKAPLPAPDANSKQPGKKQTVGGMISSFLDGNSEDQELQPSPEQAALNKNLREELVWDGLALLYRNGVSYAVEPHVSGGVPLVATQDPNAKPAYYINDILGSTLAVVTPDHIEIAPMTAFGKPVGPKPNASNYSSQTPPSVVQPIPVAPEKGQNQN